MRPAILERESSGVFVFSEFMKKLFSFVSRNLGMGEILFVAGMILLYSGVTVLLDPAWARVACGIILIPVGFVVGRKGWLWDSLPNHAQQFKTQLPRH